MKPRVPRLRISDWMIGTAVAAAVLQSEVDPLHHPDQKYLLAFTREIYPLVVFPCYCLFVVYRLNRGGSLTRTDYLAAGVMFLSLTCSIHSHMSESDVWNLRLTVVAMGLLTFDVLRKAWKRYGPGRSNGSPPS